MVAISPMVSIKHAGKVTLLSSKTQFNKSKTIPTVQITPVSQNQKRHLNGYKKENCDRRTKASKGSE